MRIVINIPSFKFRDIRKIPYYLKYYRNLPEPQWGNPSKKIGVWQSLKLWWIIEGE